MTTIVCLDVDGCLIDADRPMMSALNDALATLRLPAITLTDVRPHLGPPLMTTLTRLREALGADPSLAATLAQRYRRSYAGTSVAEARVYPGIDRCLQQLAHAGSRLLVVSSKPAVFSRPVLDAAGQLGHFSGVYGPVGAETEPKTETLARALRDHVGHSAVMVGDTVHDVEAARANGVPSIAVSWGYGDATDLARIGPDGLIDRPDELPDAVAAVVR